MTRRHLSSDYNEKRYHLTSVEKNEHNYMHNVMKADFFCKILTISVKSIYMISSINLFKKYDYTMHSAHKCQTFN